jgi:hypothetical protein
MKSKGNSLYEVLKSASRPSGADEGAPTGPEAPASPASEGAQATLQERLAAYKAARLAAATQSPAGVAVETAPARPSASTLVLEPDPTPIPSVTATREVRPAPSAPAQESEATPLPAAPSKGPGERVVKLTYNNVLFGSMIGVGLLFISYAVGLHVGKSGVPVDPPPAEARTPLKALSPLPAPVPAPLPAPPPAPKREYTIRLGEWKIASNEERVKALALANDPDLKKALERTGHKSFEKAFITRGAEPRMALYVDRFADLNSEAAKSALTAMKTFKFGKQTPFALAVFEEVQPR